MAKECTLRYVFGSCGLPVVPGTDKCHAHQGLCKKGHSHRSTLARQSCDSRLTREQIADASKMNANVRVEEASTLGLAPGHWPRTLKYAGVTWEKVSDQRDAEGDVLTTTYVSSEDGYTKLEVVND